MENLISIGKILGFHGIKGEVKLGYTKGRESTLTATKSVFVKGKDGLTELHIESIRFHKTFALIKYKEFNSINDVEQFKGLHVYTNKKQIEKSLEDDEYLVSDLAGLKAFDKNGNYLGVICAVGENKATNVISLEDDNKKVHLIPFVKDLVPVIDLKNNEITINNIEGLIE